MIVRRRVYTGMSTYVDTGSRTDSRGRPVPAYGPVDAVLGFVLFYVIVDRATPTVVDVTTGILPDVSLVGLGLAMALWFVLAVTVVDQARRQLAALGVVSHDDVTTRSRAVPSETRALAYLVLVLVGGALAAWTFDRAVDTAVSLIRVVAALDAAAFVPADFFVMVAFFVSFGVATHALDGLVIGGIRAILAD